MNKPLLDTQIYPVPELILFVAGCFMWVIVYAIFIQRILQRKLIEMPFIAAASNIAWEFLWGFVFYPDMGKLIHWGYKAWAILDILIIYAVIQYGDWQVSSAQAKRFYKLLCAGIALFWLAVYYFLKRDGYDTPIGANSAYIAQILISIYYIPLILKSPLEKFSYPVLWLRTVGTGLITVFMFMHYTVGQNGLLHTLAAASLVLDCFCIYVFIQKRKGASWTLA